MTRTYLQLNVVHCTVATDVLLIRSLSPSTRERMGRSAAGRHPVAPPRPGSEWRRHLRASSPRGPTLLECDWPRFDVFRRMRPMDESRFRPSLRGRSESHASEN